MKNKKLFLFLFALFAIILPLSFVEATDSEVASRFSGRILIKVESGGQAWYINPNDGWAYSLGRPQDSLSVMKKLGLGINEKDFGLLVKKDQKKLKKLSGRILLRVERNGEAWYINPVDLSLNYLGRPQDAFSLMKKVGLGISNDDFSKNVKGLFLFPVTLSSTSPSSSVGAFDCSGEKKKIAKLLDGAGSCSQDSDCTAINFGFGESSSFDCYRPFNKEAYRKDQRLILDSFFRYKPSVCKDSDFLSDCYIKKSPVTAKCVSNKCTLEGKMFNSPYSFDLNFSEYEIKKIADNYDVVKLKNLSDNISVSYNYSEDKPYLPVLKFNKKLSALANVRDAEIIFSDQVSLGKLNIPAIKNIGNDNASASGTPINCVKDGVYPKKQFSFYRDNKKENDFSFLVYPIVYNTETGEATLYRKAKVVFYGQRLDGLVYDGSSINKKKYGVGEDVIFSANFTNNSNEDKDILVELQVMAGTSTRKVFTETVPAGFSGEVVKEIIKANFIEGNHALYIEFYDPMGLSEDKYSRSYKNLLGRSSYYFRAEKGEAVFLNVPKKIKFDEPTAFEVSVENLANKKVTGSIVYSLGDATVKLDNGETERKFELEIGETKKIKDLIVFAKGDYQPGINDISISVFFDGRDSFDSTFFGEVSLGD